MPKPEGYKGLEPKAANGADIPPAVWASLALAVLLRFIPYGGSGLIGSLMGWVIVSMVGHLMGLILGIVGRGRVEGSDHTARVLAYIAIGWNGLGLVGSALMVLQGGFAL